MKKIISLILAVSVFQVVFCGGFAAAKTAAYPAENLVFHIDASEKASIETIAQGSTKRVSKWYDISESEQYLSQDVKNSAPTYYPDAAKSDLKDDRAAVHFAKNTYLTSQPVDYSGSASFVIYLRILKYDEGSTLFSSHSLGNPDEGKTPFSIVINEQKGLSLKMNEETYDMNVSLETNGEAYDGYMALYLTFDEENKEVKVYKTRATEQSELLSPAAILTLTELPYWESYSYGLLYSQKNKGVVADVAESMIYNRALTLDELNDVNSYLKLKYEYPVLSRLALENEIYEIKKGTTIEPKIIGVGTLMGEESRISVTDATIKSENEEAVIVLDNKTLKALNFGSSKITISYDGLPDYSFVVNVPQTVINDPVCTESDNVINVKEKIENFKEEQTLSIIVAVALYKDNMLFDIKFEKASIGLEHTFEAELSKPAGSGDYEIYIMILDGETMIPITDAIVK